MIKCSFAEYLDERKYHEEGGHMYSDAGKHGLAMKCFAKTENARMVYTSALRAGLQGEELLAEMYRYAESMETK